MTDRISKDDAVNKDLHRRQEWLSLCSVNSVDIQLAVISDFPRSEHTWAISKDMLQDQSKDDTVTCLVRRNTLYWRLHQVNGEQAHELHLENAFDVVNDGGVLHDV